MLKNYNEIKRACKNYQEKFDKLLLALTVSYINKYAQSKNKVMPINVAHFLAYTTINKLVEKKII